MPGPEDTTKRDPVIHLLGMMSDGTSGYIEGMERQGTISQARSSTLPTKGLAELPPEWGIVIGEPADDLFTEVTLPEGWRVVTTSHSMGNRLLNAEGREVAQVFYKAAFYDRRADIHQVRFDPETQDWCRDPNCGHVVPVGETDYSVAGEWWCTEEQRCHEHCSKQREHKVYPHAAKKER